MLILSVSFTYCRRTWMSQENIKCYTNIPGLTNLTRSDPELQRLEINELLRPTVRNTQQRLERLQLRTIHHTPDCSGTTWIHRILIPAALPGTGHVIPYIAAPWIPALPTTPGSAPHGRQRGPRAPHTFQCLPGLKTHQRHPLTSQ